MNEDKTDIKLIKRKYLKRKKTDDLLKGCFDKKDFKKYELWQELASESEKGYGYITIEETKGRWVKVYTIKVSEIRALRGTAFFIYDNQIVFEYNQEENIRIGVDTNQEPYEFEYYNYPQNISHDELVEIVERLLDYHYDDIYHVWMSRYDVDKFADQLDLCLSSRLDLHGIYLDYCQKQFIRNHECENPIINERKEELRQDPRFYIGYKSYDRYLSEDSLVSLSE